MTLTHACDRGCAPECASSCEDDNAEPKLRCIYVQAKEGEWGCRHRDRERPDRVEKDEKEPRAVFDRRPLDTAVASCATSTGVQGDLLNRLAATLLTYMLRESGGVEWSGSSYRA